MENLDRHEKQRNQEVRELSEGSFVCCGAGSAG